MNLPKNRWLAFASHFGVSLLLFIFILLIIVFLWYPGALFAAAGGWQGLKIVIGVDLVLGPLLTLIVYTTNKPRKVLLRDLSIIAFIQLSCLTAGVLVVSQERPVAVIYAYNKFYALKHSDFIASGKDPGSLDLNLMTPKIFYTDYTKLSDSTGIDKDSISQLFTMLGENLAYRTDLYEIFPNTREEAESVLGNGPQKPRQRAECVTVELVSAYAQGVACFNTKTRRFEDFREAKTNPDHGSI